MQCDRNQCILTLAEAELAAELLTGLDGLQSLELLLAKATAVLRSMESEHRDTEHAHKKRNWKAAAVAGECRLAWAEEHREIESPEWLNYLDQESNHSDYGRRLWGFAPSQHQDTPGPFGRFLNDVLENSDIQNNAGETVSAAVALRSWKSASKSVATRYKQKAGK